MPLAEIASGPVVFWVFTGTGRRVFKSSGADVDDDFEQPDKTNPATSTTLARTVDVRFILAPPDDKAEKP
jgi:hypothetical protein